MLSGLRNFMKRWNRVLHCRRSIKREVQGLSPEEHEHTGERLRQSEERLQLLIESIQDYAIYILDPNGVVTSWNSGAQRIKGYTADEIIGEHYSRFYTADDVQSNKPSRNLEIAASKGKIEEESLRVRKDGSVFWANVVITPIRDVSGNLTGFAKVVRDITERKAADERLRDAERLATLGTTAAVFAHEIANPLNGISSSLQIVTALLEEVNFHDPLVEETIRSAHQEIQRLATMLKDYRSLARPQALQIQESNIRTVVEEVLAPNIKIYNDSGVTVQTRFDENLPLVPLDAARIKQVVLNLCKNAVEAMPNGGILTVKTYQSDDKAVLEISDTGQGIPEGFDPFHLFKTTKREGTGLGLSIVQQIMSEHHGSVDYISEDGKGTTFRVSLRLPASRN
jgi:PAS domain S-box-containing protein